MFGWGGKWGGVGSQGGFGGIWEFKGVPKKRFEFGRFRAGLGSQGQV